MIQLKLRRYASYLFGLQLLFPAATFSHFYENSESSDLPKSWYQLPEETSLSPETTEKSDSLSEKKLGLLIEKIFDTSQNALDRLPSSSSIPFEKPLESYDSDTHQSLPRDWVPWRLAYLTTELGITLQELLGILTIKGTAAIQALWRQQGTSPPSQPSNPPHQIVNESKISSYPSEKGDPQSIISQIEPIVRAAEKSEQVKDIKVFRRNLVATAKSLEEFLDGLASHPVSEWWPSRFRFDFIVDGQGNILPAVYLGANLRFRFEWHHIQRKTPKNPKNPYWAQKGDDLAQMKLGLQQFSISMGKILSKASKDPSLASKGFQPYMYRMGIGAIAGGSIGLAQASNTAIGMVYFSKAVPAPIVYPFAKPTRDTTDSGGSNDSGESGESNNSDDSKLNLMPIINSFAKAETLAFAKHTGIQYKIESESQNGVPNKAITYFIKPEQIIKGLKKAVKIGEFFASHGSKSNQGKWKVHSLFAEFQLSITGDFIVASVGETALAKIYFYNREF